jgi:hypothetical protein
MGRFGLVCVLVGLLWSACMAQNEPLFKETLDVNIPHVSTDRSLTKLPSGTLAVSVRDHQGHWSRIERQIHVGQ